MVRCGWAPGTRCAPLRRAARRTALLTMVLLGLAAVCAADEPWTEEGIASWYGPGFAGRPTASTEIYDPDLLTAAHKTLPLGSLVRVYNLENGLNMIVRINDRGPFIDGRVIDLSRACAEVLGCKDSGLARVRLILLTDPQQPNRFASRVAPTPETVATEPWTTSEDRVEEPPATGYYVQVGAFSHADNAESLLEQTGRLGMQAYIEEDGGQHRVLVGPYASFTQASAAQRDLERAGIDGFLRLSNR